MSAPRLQAEPVASSLPPSAPRARQTRAASLSSSAVPVPRADPSQREGAASAASGASLASSASSADRPHTASLHHHHHHHQHHASEPATASHRPRRRSSAAPASTAASAASTASTTSTSSATSTSAAALNGNTTAPPPQLPALPPAPMLLPATIYDPNSPTTASTANSPSTAGLFTPTLLAAIQPTDYFNSKPRPPLTAHRPPSRTNVDRLLGRSPLPSPAILAPADPAAAPARPASAARPAAASTRDPAHKSTPSAGHARSASRDHQRSESRDTHNRSESRGHYRSSSRDHNRSESTSSRFDDAHHDTPPRTRERREKDKKTMLSRALQKANTAVLLDNAQNFEGAMEAYEDACKLLQQVMIRSSQDDDRRKLDAIVSSPR